MQIFGKFLDMALTPGLADRSLENFIDEIAAATQARVDQREAEFARYRFYSPIFGEPNRARTVASLEAGRPA